MKESINIIGEEVKQLILGCSFEYGCCVEEGMSRFYFLSKPHILQRVEQDGGDLLPVYSSLSLLLLLLSA